MNILRYSTIFMVCALTLLLCACTQNRVSVVNTSSGIVIKADDYVSITNDNREKQVSRKTTSTGNVIHLGNSYEKIDLPPLGRF